MSRSFATGGAGQLPSSGAFAPASRVLSLAALADGAPTALVSPVPVAQLIDTLRETTAISPCEPKGRAQGHSHSSVVGARSRALTAACSGQPNLPKSNGIARVQARRSGPARRPYEG